MIPNLLRFVLENPLILGKLDGYKTLIGRAVMIAGSAIAVLPHLGIELPLASDITGALVTIAGWAGVELGTWHKVDKIVRK